LCRGHVSFFSYGIGLADSCETGSRRTFPSAPSGARSAGDHRATGAHDQEFVAANDNGLPDNTGAFEDWIELHNTSGSAINLAGWTIADGDAVFTFDSRSIPGNGYLVVFASDAVSRTTSSQLHLPFKLSADGEPLSLRDPGGVVSSPSFPAPGFPAVPTDVSYGRTGSGLGFFTSPTPGSANNGASSGIVEPVTFSIDHGFYSTTQNVVLNTATPGATIRYTLDASTPSSTNGQAVSPGSSVTISSTSTLRAVAYRSGWIPSSTETRSYLFTADIVQQPSNPAGWPANGSVDNAMDYAMNPTTGTAAAQSSLTAIPSISIVTDQANLTNPSTGIYVNAQRSGIDWERPASVELIDPSGAEPGFEINAGVRIRGGGSRSSSNPKHSLRLYFRDDYGDGSLDYDVFGPDGLGTFESFGLATGQNGSWQFRQPNDATWIRELWSRRTQGSMGQPDTDSRYFHVYLNGLYWGLYVGQERLSGFHGEQHFGGNEDDFDVVGGNWLSAGSASDGTTAGLQALWPIVQDLTISDSEFATLDAQVNLENLADYFLLHYFSGDFDASPMGWSTSNGRWADSNNWRAVRNRTGVGEAGKWLFFDHDSEISLCTQQAPTNLDNTAPWPLQNGTVPNHQVVTPAWLHQSLLTHPVYRAIFRDRVAEQMQTPGGALTVPVGQTLVDQLIAETDGAIDAESARWGDYLGTARTRNDWLANVAEVRTCIADRFSVVQAQLEADGLWPTNAPPLITPASGAVAYGTDVTIDANGEPGVLWYTTDGSDPRGLSGLPSTSATAYSGPIQVTSNMTIRARVLIGESWLPLGEQSYSLSTPAGPIRLLLNEYNAVSGSKFLGGGFVSDTANGSDATLGRIAGNGGDWFELVALEDLDISGWTFEVWHLDTGLLERSAALTVSSSAPTLQAGTILTVSEDIADDISFSPSQGDWHVNFQANSTLAGAYFTAASQTNFAIDKDDTQIAVFDASGAPVALRTGEGTTPNASVNSEEVFKLEAPPSASVSFNDVAYQDGTTSTFGLPNQWAGGTQTQDFSSLRLTMGDVNCDNRLTVADAVVISQHTVGLRTPVTACPMNASSDILLAGADVNGSGGITVADAVIVAQCIAGIDNGFCPG